MTLAGEAGPDMESDRVSVVIVTFNNAPMLANLLADLSRQRRPPDEVIVIDNASRDDTQALVRGVYPEADHVRLGENLGSAGGYHEGIRRAARSSDFIYTLDDDVRLNPDTLQEIVAGFHALEGAMPGQIAAVRSVGASHPHAAPTPLEVVPWRGTLFKTAIVREVGLPSPDYFLYGEDLEYSLRIAQRGYRFYWIPTSRCLEAVRERDGKARATLFGRRLVRYQSPFRLYYAFRNEVSIFIRYGRRAALLRTFLYALKILLMIGASERWTGKRPIRALVLGIFDGIRGRMGRHPDYTPG